MSSLEIALKLLAVVLLVAANAFFVAAEFALVSAEDARLARMASRGDRLARTVRSAQKELNLYLSSCQVGITLASLGLGWIGEPALAETMSSTFGGLPAPFDWLTRHAVAATIAFTIITFLHVVLGELMPKALAIFHPEPVARWTVWPLIAFTRAGAPLIWTLNETANVLLRMLGFRLPSEAERVHSPEEIKMLVRRSRELGKLDLHEQAMIYGVFELTGTMTREVMTPRPDIVALPDDVGFDELVATTRESGHSRIPIYRENLDDVVGIVLVKDLLATATGEHQDFDVKRIMREPHFVPDTKPVLDLLAELRRLKTHMAIVVDEFGGTDGLVTLEDLIEEIVGEIYDEYDVARPIFSTTTRGEPLIDGGAPLDDVNDRYGLRLPLEDYDTLGGFILGELGHVPRRGETVTVAGASLVVERVDERRIRAVRLVKRTEEAGGPERKAEAPPAGPADEGGA